MEDEKLYQVALSLVPGIGDVHAKNLISYCGSSSAIFKSKTSFLLKIPGIGEKNASAILSTNKLSEAETILNSCEKTGISIHHYTDKSYPERLKQLADCPNLIYTKGKGSVNPPRALAIVGTRNATNYGKQITENIAKGCSMLQATMISGLAYGIDICAHRSSLSDGIPNLAVLAGGLDCIYPSAHKKTAEEIMESGLLISEKPPGTKPEAHYFPARNRIISGLSDAVIVTEAAKKGGALITADIAHSYDKPVFAVPGNLDNPFSEGCNQLIRNQKAYIYTDLADILYHLNWDLDISETKPKPAIKNLPTEQQKVYDVLYSNNQGISVDDLSWKSQIPINQLASILLTMEFSGIIKSLPGKKYQLISKG